MSLQATDARWAADDAARGWKEHRQHCPECGPASRKRRWASLCGKGAELRRAQVRTAAALNRSRDLDRRPPPGPGIAVLT